MSAVCSMQGCKAKAGMCIHDKMMLMLVGLGALAAAGHWGLGWF